MQHVAFVRLAFFPDGTAAQYDALAAELAGTPVPQDRLVFAAGAVDGGWQVVQVWRTREALDAFNEAVLQRALRRLGDRAFPRPPRVTDLEPAVLEMPLAGPGGQAYGPGMRLR